MSDDEIHYPQGFSLQDLVGYGNTGLVVLDSSSNTVIKTPIDEKCTNYLTIERLIYERLTQSGGHSGILSYHGVDLKSFTEDADNAPTAAQRLRWVEKIAEALLFIHSTGVVHGDLRAANVLLDENLDPKVADFAGSSLDSSPLLVESAGSYQYPGSSVSVEGDIFAFGSLVYEIMTGREPYEGVDGDETRALYGRKCFPDTEPLGGVAHIVEKCWKGGYSGCDALLEDLK
ncbi:hypothetical protein VE03_00364 [Pseudogymnoascus sp. 23342-1-I1]|nr:hypothetical protein VE03_00364 [Pseudogymnoascus sp. 23342-1-I1]